jgi:hypothetical protein
MGKIKFAQIAVPIAVCCVALAIGALLRQQASVPNRHEVRPGAPSPTVREHADESSSSRASILSTAAPALPARATAPPSIRLQREFASAKDLRQFAYSAASRPQEGGYFYAKTVAFECASSTSTVPGVNQGYIHKAVETSGTVSMAQLAAAQRSESECATFAPGEAWALYKEMRVKEKDGADPLANATGAVRAALYGGGVAAPRDAEALKIATRALLATDGMALGWDGLLHKIAMSDPEAGKTGGMFFDGQVYKSDENLGLALTMATCQQDLPCAMDEYIKTACLVRGDCAPDRVTYAKTTEHFTDEQFAKVIELTERIRQKIDAKDVSAFVR